MANDVLDRNRQATPEDDEQQRKPRFGGAHPDTATDGHQGVYDEKFKDLQASGAMGADPEARQLSPEKLKSAEENGAAPKASRGDKKEQAASGGGDQIGGGYDAHDSGGLGGKIKSWFTGKAGKRKAIGVSIAGLLSVGALGLFSVLHGPLQLVHLSKILGKFSASNESSIRIRTGNLFRNTRAANTGDIGESRVSILGSRRFQNIETQLKNAGIEFQRDPRTGKPVSTSIDAAKNPNFKEGTLQQKRAAIAKFYDIDIGKVQQTSGLGGGKFGIPMKDLNIKATRSLAFSSLKNVESGRILNAMNKRVMAKFFNVPSMFKPFERAKASVENRSYARLDRRARERERSQKRKGTLRQKYAIQKGRVKDAVEPHRRAITGALFVTGAVCTIKTVADAIPVVNYSAIVIPSMLEAVDKQAVGSQNQSNKDFDINQMGDVVASFEDDEGRTIWQGKALNALASGSTGEGEDIDEKYKQAFSTETTGSTIIDVLVDNGATDVACSGPGLVLQGLVGLGLLALGPGGWGVKTLQAGASTVATAAAIGFLQDLAIDYLTEDTITAFAGPQGGNLLAHGARAGHNLNAVSMGGVALSDTEERIVTKELEEQEMEEFQAKSFFARMFDTNEPRSLIGHAVRSTSSSPTRNISSLVSTVSNPFKLVANSLSALTPKILAAEGSYDWSFPLYGIPREVLDSPVYEDPYDNAERAAELFSGSEGTGYIERARTCFGAEISKGSNGWDAIKVEEINPTEDAYIAKKCDENNEDWVRVRMFVFDTSIVTLIDCYEGDEASCQQIFSQGSQDTSSTPGSASGDAINGDPYSDSSAVACAPGTDDLGPNEGYSDGVKFAVRLCSLPNLPSDGQADNPGGKWSTPGAKGFAIVNSRVSGAWFKLVNDAKVAGINLSVNSSFRSMPHQQSLFAANPDTSLVARPGYSSHQAGVAIDFNSMGVKGGGTCATRARMPGNPSWQWLYDNADRYGFKQYSKEAWHWDALPAANRCGPS